MPEGEGEIAGLSFSMVRCIEGKGYQYAIDGKPLLLWMHTGGMYRVELSLVLQHCCLGRLTGESCKRRGLRYRGC